MRLTHSRSSAGTPLRLGHRSRPAVGPPRRVFGRDDLCAPRRPEPSIDPAANGFTVPGWSCGRPSSSRACVRLSRQPCTTSSMSTGITVEGGPEIERLLTCRIRELSSSRSWRTRVSEVVASRRAKVSSRSLRRASAGGRYEMPSLRTLLRTHHISSWGLSKPASGLPAPGRSSNSPRSRPSRITWSIQDSQFVPGGFRLVTS